MEYRLVGGIKYIVATCKMCGREFLTHPRTYKAKMEKNVCVGCLAVRGGEDKQRMDRCETHGVKNCPTCVVY